MEKKLVPLIFYNIRRLRLNVERKNKRRGEDVFLHAVRALGN